MTKRILAIAGVLILVPTLAPAADVVEIRHASLLDRSSYTVVYWCLEKGDVPQEYLDTKNYSLVGLPVAVAESGLYIMSNPDNSVFLTSDTCADETMQRFQEMGGNPDDLTFTPK